MKKIRSKNIISSIIVCIVMHTNLAFANSDLERCRTLISQLSFNEGYAVCKTAAEQGLAVAQFILGNMYYDGDGVTQDYAEAARWWRDAAEQGLANAQINLGYMYENGEGVIQDYTEAAKWYRAAAEQAHAVAQYNLGVIYAKGEGVIQDYLLAHMWFNISAANGNVSAAEARNLVSQLMSHDQIAQAQELARQCLDSNYTDCGWK